MVREQVKQGVVLGFVGLLSAAVLPLCFVACSTGGLLVATPKDASVDTGTAGDAAVNKHQLNDRNEFTADAGAATANL